MAFLWSLHAKTHDRDGYETARLGLFGSFVVALAVAVILSFLWVGNLRCVAAAPGWPTVDGRVTASSSTPRGKHSRTYDVIADIEYTVGGQKYELYAMEIATGVSHGEASAKRPAQGSTIKVWHDPADPGRSTLVATWSDAHTWRLWILIGCWGIVLAILPVLGWRLHKASQGVLYGAQ